MTLSINCFRKTIKRATLIICLAALLSETPIGGISPVFAATLQPKTMSSFVKIVDQRMRKALLTEEKEYIRVDLSDLNFDDNQAQAQSYQLDYLLPYFCDEIQLCGTYIGGGIYDYLTIEKNISKSKVKTHRCRNCSNHGRCEESYH